MYLSRTFFFYMARQFFVGIAVVFVALVIVAQSADLVELLRRASGHPEIGFGVVLEMSLLQLPSLSFRLMPFALLFGSMLTLTRLTRNQELVVARAAGVSVWQFLMPGLVLAALVGAIEVTVFNPISAAMVSHFQQLEARYFQGQSSMLSVSENGLWLREAGADGGAVVHALRAANKGRKLWDVTIFLFRGQDQFAGRIDAARATLKSGYWGLTHAVVTMPGEPSKLYPNYRLKTTLTVSQIEDSFASPGSLSFWRLPGFIHMLQKNGFSAVRHELRWNELMSLPLLYVAMVLIATAFSLRFSRQGGIGLLLAGGVIAGFVLYFLSSLVFELGRTGTIPVLLAAWTPAGISVLLGISSVLYTEDG